jgi:hypothetical protein
LRFSEYVSAATVLSPARDCKPHCKAPVQRVDAKTNLAALFDQFPEQPDNGDITEREDGRPDQGDAEQIHGGMRKP